MAALRRRMASLGTPSGPFPDVTSSVSAHGAGNAVREAAAPSPASMVSTGNVASPLGAPFKSLSSAAVDSSRVASSVGGVPSATVGVPAGIQDYARSPVQVSSVSPSIFKSIPRTQSTASPSIAAVPPAGLSSRPPSASAVRSQPHPQSNTASGSAYNPDTYGSPPRSPRGDLAPTSSQQVHARGAGLASLSYATANSNNAVATSGITRSMIPPGMMSEAARRLAPVSQYARAAGVASPPPNPVVRGLSSGDVELGMGQLPASATSTERRHPTSIAAAAVGSTMSVPAQSTAVPPPQHYTHPGDPVASRPSTGASSALLAQNLNADDLKRSLSVITEETNVRSDGSDFTNDRTTVPVQSGLRPELLGDRASVGNPQSPSAIYSDQRRALAWRDRYSSAPYDLAPADATGESVLRSAHRAVGSEEALQHAASLAAGAPTQPAHIVRSSAANFYRPVYRPDDYRGPGNAPTVGAVPELLMNSSSPLTRQPHLPSSPRASLGMASQPDVPATANPIAPRVRSPLPPQPVQAPYRSGLPPFGSFPQQSRPKAPNPDLSTDDLNEAQMTALRAQVPRMATEYSRNYWWKDAVPQRSNPAITAAIEQQEQQRQQLLRQQEQREQEAALRQRMKEQQEYEVLQHKLREERDEKLQDLYEQYAASQRMVDNLSQQKRDDMAQSRDDHALNARLAWDERYRKQHEHAMRQAEEQAAAQEQLLALERERQKLRAQAAQQELERQKALDRYFPPALAQPKPAAAPPPQSIARPPPPVPPPKPSALPHPAYPGGAVPYIPLPVPSALVPRPLPWNPTTEYRGSFTHHPSTEPSPAPASRSVGPMTAAIAVGSGLAPFERQHRPVSQVPSPAPRPIQEPAPPRVSFASPLHAPSSTASGSPRYYPGHQLHDQEQQRRQRAAPRSAAELHRELKDAVYRRQGDTQDPDYLRHRVNEEVVEAAKARVHETREKERTAQRKLQLNKELLHATTDRRRASMDYIPRVGANGQILKSVAASSPRPGRYSNYEPATAAHAGAPFIPAHHPARPIQPLTTFARTGLGSTQAMFGDLHQHQRSSPKGSGSAPNSPFWLPAAPGGGGGGGLVPSFSSSMPLRAPAAAAPHYQPSQLAAYHARALSASLLPLAPSLSYMPASADEPFHRPPPFRPIAASVFVPIAGRTPEERAEEAAAARRRQEEWLIESELERKRVHRWEELQLQRQQENEEKARWARRQRKAVVPPHMAGAFGSSRIAIADSVATRLHDAVLVPRRAVSPPPMRSNGRHAVTQTRPIEQPRPSTAPASRPVSVSVPSSPMRDMEGLPSQTYVKPTFVRRPAQVESPLRWQSEYESNFRSPQQMIVNRPITIVQHDPPAPLLPPQPVATHDFMSQVPESSSLALANPSLLAPLHAARVPIAQPASAAPPRLNQLMAAATQALYQRPEVVAASVTEIKVAPTRTNPPFATDDEGASRPPPPPVVVTVDEEKRRLNRMPLQPPPPPPSFAPSAVNVKPYTAVPPSTIERKRPVPIASGVITEKPYSNSQQNQSHLQQPAAAVIRSVPYEPLMPPTTKGTSTQTEGPSTIIPAPVVQVHVPVRVASPVVSSVYYSGQSQVYAAPVVLDRSSAVRPSVVHDLELKDDSLLSHSLSKSDLAAMSHIDRSQTLRPSLVAAMDAPLSPPSLDEQKLEQKLVDKRPPWGGRPKKEVTSSGGEIRDKQQSSKAKYKLVNKKKQEAMARMQARIEKRRYPIPRQQLVQPKAAGDAPARGPTLKGKPHPATQVENKAVERKDQVMNAIANAGAAARRHNLETLPQRVAQQKDHVTAELLRLTKASTTSHNDTHDSQGHDRETEAQRRAREEFGFSQHFSGHQVQKASQGVQTQSAGPSAVAPAPSSSSSAAAAGFHVAADRARGRARPPIPAAAAGALSYPPWATDN